ncbi:hypothetical protein CDG60_12385 [Acinetobacter chinensis]|uniref:Uncharacterized protein n=1 Tax=Acinetobacter chinensis TaxID=2004650 RepID=A0A3B7LZ54_9GAMM|nr:hypothetical protein [Acinetobacter chinensis]AXY57295.1 hypothetical protein CDG60_12385 [Acinetobacter chinensis]
MKSNLAHDVFINQGKAIALANQVDDWLEAQGKSEPVQIPFGQSRLSLKSKDNEYKTGQQSMRESTSNSISKNGPVLSSKVRPLTKEQERQKYNFNAKNKALAAGENEFKGNCDLHGITDYKVYNSGKYHCLQCHERTKQLRKEA